MIKTAKLPIIVTLASVLLCTLSFIAFADTTGTPEITPTTVSSVKIDRNGNLIPESPTTSTTLAKSPTSSTTTKAGSSDNSNNDADANDSNAGQATEKTTMTPGNKNKNPGDETSDNKSTDTGKKSDAKNTNTNEESDSDNLDTTTINGSIDNNDNDGSSNDLEASESEKTKVAGEQIENPDLSGEQGSDQKEDLETNPIGFDIKPYLAMAVLVMLAGTTVFSNKQLTAGANGTIRDNRYKRSGLS